MRPSCSVFQKQSMAYFQQEAICYDSTALQIGDTPDNGSFHIFSYPTPADITNLHTSSQIKEIFEYLIIPRTTKLWREYRICPVCMYVSMYVRTFVHIFFFCHRSSDLIY